MNKSNSVIRVVGPYSLHRDGTWTVNNPQTGRVTVNPNESRSLRFELILSLAKRWGAGAFKFENKQYYTK